jgi:predicted GNAT family acetyltransferase
MADPRVADDPDRRRYELHVGDGLVGFVSYRRESDSLVLVHTEIDPAVRGQGLGSHLVAETLDDIRRRGLTAVPLCPFVAAYIRRNPGYASLVAGG